MSNLEHAAIGAWRGQPRAVEDAVTEARAAVARRRAEREAVALREHEKMTLRVRRSFHAIGGRIYGLGEYRIDQDEADELDLWKVRMEADAKAHGWDAPVGFMRDTWPPFEIAE